MTGVNMDLAGGLLTHLPHEVSRVLFRAARPSYFNYTASTPKPESSRGL
jgi:hypothetical protein